MRPVLAALFGGWIAGCGAVVVPTVEILVEGPGRVTAAAPAIDCPDISCTATLPATLREVELTAVPAPGASLVRWSVGSCGAALACRAEVGEGHTVISATFAPPIVPDDPRLEINVIGTGAFGGRVASDSGGIDCPGTCAATFEAGVSIVLTASASAFVRFDGWNGAGCGGTGACEVSNLREDTAVTAVFTDISVPITVRVEGSGRGSVVSTPLGIACAPECVARFAPGDRVTVIASPENGSRFHGWSGACASFGRAASCVLEAELAAEAGATFHANIVRAVGFGLGHSCALLDPDVLRCFGDGTDGQLGYGDTRSRGDGVGPAANAADVDLPAISDVGLGNWHSCAISDGDVYCWGRNQDGQLGMGDFGAGANSTPRGPLDFGGATVSDVEGGAFHSCALAGGDVRCWGRGNDGVLGTGDTSMRTRPGPRVAIFGDDAVAKLAVGGLHNCVLLQTGSVRCWGANQAGQLGYGDTAPRGTTTASVGDVDLGGDIAEQLVTGGSHTCVLLRGGAVRCWGRNDEGQLGLNDTTPRGNKPIDLPLQENVPLPDEALEITAGNSHTCARLRNGGVYCWGWNFGGQLGYGDTENRGDGLGPNVADRPLAFGSTTVDHILAHKTNTTCAIVGGGELSCWGYGGNGQLGYGNTTNRGDGVGAPAATANVPIF